MLDKKVQVSALQYVNVKPNQSKKVDTIDLSTWWMLSPDQAKNTVRKKNQRRIRMVMNLHMPWNYPTNERIMRYPRLTHTIFTDTMIDGNVYNRGNKNAQVYGTSFVWTHFSNGTEY